MAASLSRGVAAAQTLSARSTVTARRGSVARRGSGLGQAILGDVLGAVNAVSHALTAAPYPGQAIAPKGPSKRIREPVVCEALPAGLDAELDYRPTLSTWDYCQAFLCSGAVCAVVYFLLSSHVVGWRLAVTLALSLLLLLRVATALQQERQLQARMRSEVSLAAADSLFQGIMGIKVHLKRSVPEPKSPTPAENPPPSAVVHCCHGFGANTYSWAFCQQKLATQVNGVVTAHDTPGFGLTQRPLSLGAYTTAFNGKIGRAIMEEQAEQCEGAGGGQSGVQRVLMGHSMGGAAVVEEVVARPEGIDAVVLVAPAVIALSSSPSTPTDAGWLRRGAAAAGNVLSVLVSSTVGVVLLLLQPLLVWLLRAAVRSRIGLNAARGGHYQLWPEIGTDNRMSFHHASAYGSFWERGLQSAWYDKRGVTPELVDAYRMPQLVKGWEGGLLRFVRAKLTGSATTVSRLRSAMEPVMLLSMAERFAAAVRQHNIRVLLVHGKQDALVPVSNSRRLAALLGCRLIEVERCGHQPQEEMPDEFVKWVADFMEQPRDERFPSADANL